MATTDCVDGDYLGAYSRFFSEFVARVNPDDQLPVKVSTYDLTENELVGEIVSVTLQYLNQTYCPPSLQSYIVHLVIQEIKSTCKKHPETCGLRSKKEEKTYAPLKLMQAVTNEVNEICRQYLDNSKLALLPPPSSTPLPQMSVGAIRNARRKMEDRNMILHDIHTMFNIQDDSMANYYAVFDGHGGQDAAAYCATHLHQYLVESVHYPTDPERALRDAFLTTDAKFIAKSSKQKLNGGSTAVCALLLNKKLYVAWVGDSIATLVKHGSIKQLVNPHRPTREDEIERIRNLGGLIVHCMGVPRVNGFLSISRAIGDIPYKPCISNEPEIRCIPLDGTEDFLIIACDGLWDYVDQRTAALEIYNQLLQNPHDLKYVSQTLLHSAKVAGSLDNITVIVVFLTPPTEIASRRQNAHSHLAHPVPNGLLNNMDPNNPFLSNVNGQFDVNAAFVKQQQLDADLQRENGTGLNLDDNRMIYEASSNGKHEDSDRDANDEYDYCDLGPETDVDAVDDGPDMCAPLDRLSRELFPNEKSRITKEDNNKHDPIHDNANICLYDGDVDNRISQSEDVYGTDEIPCNNDMHVDNDVRVKADVPVDNDESPPSPRATKLLQHALIPEADNVADSEDSEDEWNYYRIDPNKEDPAKIIKNESRDDEEKNICETPESVVKNSLEGEDDIKCERRKEDTSSELIDSNISAERKLSESEKDNDCIQDIKEEKQIEEDMDFQLNPDAAEFVPVSPSIPSNNRRTLMQDYPISGSPLKQTSVMDDIPIPSQSEFDEEVCKRPREVDEKEFTNGDSTQHADFADFPTDSHHDNTVDLDQSEISSTKAELGDESSIARIMATTHQWQANIPQWDAKMRDDGESDAEDYDIATDPMAMSFTPGDFEAAFEKGVDLNAIHDLSSTDIDDDNNGALTAEVTVPPAHSPELNEECAHASDLSIDLLRASSTPYNDKKSTFTAASERDDRNTNELSGLEMESQSSMDQFRGSLLTDDYSMECNVKKNEPIDLISQNDKPESTKDTNESAQLDIHHQLEIPNLTDSRNTDSPLLTSSVQDTLECIPMQPVQRNSISSTGDVRSNGLTSVVEPVNSSLNPNVPEVKPDQHNFDPYVPDFHCNTNENPISEDPLNSDRPAIVSSNPENVLLVEPSLTEVQTLANQQAQEDKSELISTEEIEPVLIFSNLSKQQMDNQLSLDIKPEYVIPFSSSAAEGTVKNNTELVQDFAQNEKLCNLEIDKTKSCNSNIKLDGTNALNLSDSMLEFAVVEEQLRHENQALIEKPSIMDLAPNDVLKKEHAEIIPEKINEVLEEKIISDSIPLNKKEIESPQTTEVSPDIAKVVDETKKEAARTAVTATTMIATAKSTKARTTATTTMTKRPAKTMTTTTTTKQSTLVTKTAMKSSPTSPFKSVNTTTRTSLTATQPAAVKKPSTRPKQLDGPVKATTSTIGKITVMKTATVPKTINATVPATKTSTTPRVIADATKQKALTASPKPSTAGISEKKLTTNGDVKSLSKSSTTKSASKTVTNGTTVKSTLVKSSSTATRTTTSTITSKSRPASAKTYTTTSKLTGSANAAIGATRPRTAPISSNVTKLRDTTKMTTKSPMIDKQIKETANKQISLARSGMSTVPKTGRASAPATVGSTGTAKSRVSTAKSLNTSAVSPTKKATSISKTTPRALSGTKTSSKTKMLQNGVAENTDITNSIITTTNNKLEDDVPRKDTSPVVMPNDNQLIMTD